MSRALGPSTVLRGHESDVQCCEFVDSNGVLATGDMNGMVKLWSLDECRPMLTQRLHEPVAGVLSLQYVDGATGVPALVSSGRDGSVKVWQIQGTAGLSSHPVLEVASGVFSFCRPNVALPITWTAGSQAMCSASTSAERADLAPVAAVQTKTGRSSESSRETITSSTGSRYVVPDSAAESGGSSGLAAEAGGAEAVAAVVRGWLLACAGPASGEVRVWDLRAGPASCLSFCQDTDSSKMGMSMAVSLLPSEHFGGGPGFQVLSGHEDGSVARWDSRRPKQALAAVRGHSEPVMCLDVAAGSCRAASGAADDIVCLWSLGGGGGGGTSGTNSADPAAKDHARPGSGGPLDKVVELKLSQPGCNRLAFAAEGRMLASAGWDCKVRLFSVPSPTSRKTKGRLLGLLSYHQAQVTCVRFQPGGSKLLASASRDKTAALWTLSDEPED